MTLVALRKESVDRNRAIQHTQIDKHKSLSARRAWIEIWSAVLTELLILLRSLSARRAWIEIIVGGVKAQYDKSLSARRAWIEIGLFGVDTLSYQVALRKESVDRNVRLLASGSCLVGRSPQGERG